MLNASTIGKTEWKTTAGPKQRRVVVIITLVIVVPPGTRNCMCNKNDCSGRYASYLNGPPLDVTTVGLRPGGVSGGSASRKGSAQPPPSCGRND